jgi:hypothetical protein
MALLACQTRAPRNGRALPGGGEGGEGEEEEIISSREGGDRIRKRGAEAFVGVAAAAVEREREKERENWFCAVGVWGGPE